MNITQDCDCVAWSDVPLVADIGILASTDPLAIDKASYDLVYKAKSIQPMENDGINVDKFKHAWETTNGAHIFEYGEKIGLGSLDYELVKI